MIEFQIIKIAFRQIIDRLDFFHRRNAGQSSSVAFVVVVVIQFIELGGSQRGRQEGEHINGIAVKVGLIVDVFVGIDGSPGKEAEFIDQGPFVGILYQNGGSSVALRGIVGFEQDEGIAMEGFDVNGTDHTDGGGE